MHQIYVATTVAKFSDKYGRHIYPAFADLDTHDDIVAGVENRWHAEKFYRADDVDSELSRLRAALADAICRPMGVIPDSAQGLVTHEQIHQAERLSPVLSANTQVNAPCGRKEAE